MLQQSFIIILVMNLHHGKAILEQFGRYTASEACVSCVLRLNACYCMTACRPPVWGSGTDVLSSSCGNPCGGFVAPFPASNGVCSCDVAAAAIMAADGQCFLSHSMRPRPPVRSHSVISYAGRYQYRNHYPIPQRLDCVIDHSLQERF